MGWGPPLWGRPMSRWWRPRQEPQDKGKLALLRVKTDREPFGASVEEAKTPKMGVNGSNPPTHDT